MKEKLRKYLADHRVRQIKNLKHLPAAVILPIFYKENVGHVLFIKRTDTVEHHKGQVSFPGGRREPEDKTMLDTATRELREEIGIPSEDIEVLGKLDDCTTHSSNYVISPYLALIPYPYEFKLDPGEIAYIFDVPIPELFSSSSFKSEERLLDGHRVKSYFFDCRNQVIWGATARILKQFLDIWKELETKDRSTPAS